MRFRSGAKLDTSQVSDRRGARPGLPMAIGGGGGIIGVIVVLLLAFANGGGGGSSGLQLGTGTAEENDLSGKCVTGDDANQNQDCLIVGVVNSVQQYWSSNLDGYSPSETVFFTGATATGCGNATSAVGPFYCPVDKT